MKQNKNRARPTKFEWEKPVSGAKRERTKALGFNGRLDKPGLKKTESFVTEHKEFKKEIRKPR